MQKNNLIFQSNECLTEEGLLLYLEDRLDKSTRFRVENHMLDCPLCAEAVEGFEAMDSFDIKYELENLKKAGEAKFRENSGGTTGRFFTFNKIAAAILFLVVASSALVYFNAQQTKNIFLSEFQSNSVDNLRSLDDASVDDQFKEGVEDFRVGNYTESMLFFENLLEGGIQDPTVNYFLGLSAFKAGEFSKAIENLSIARLNEPKYYEEATWHLILANVGVNNKEKAEALIADLLKIEGGFYNEKAEKILKELQQK